MDGFTWLGADTRKISPVQQLIDHRAFADIGFARKYDLRQAVSREITLFYCRTQKSYIMQIWRLPLMFHTHCTTAVDAVSRFRATGLLPDDLRRFLGRFAKSIAVSITVSIRAADTK